MLCCGGEFQSYWSQTGTYEAILPLINMDFDGLRAALIQMISGTPAEVEVRNFQNDMVSFADKDDVLTLLIHLGYLSYDREKKMAFIPNEEIREEFIAATRRKKWNELLDFQRKSKELLEATLDMDEEAVAASSAGGAEMEQDRGDSASSDKGEEICTVCGTLHGRYFAGRC